MPSYCVEKFENASGEEKIIYWRQDKHVHDAGFITTVAQALERTYGGTWTVRVNSYRSNQSKTPPNAVDYNDLE